MFGRSEDIFEEERPKEEKVTRQERREEKLREKERKKQEKEDLKQQRAAFEEEMKGRELEEKRSGLWSGGFRRVDRSCVFRACEIPAVRPACLCIYLFHREFLSA